MAIEGSFIFLIGSIIAIFMKITLYPQEKGYLFRLSYLRKQVIQCFIKGQKNLDSRFHGNDNKLAVG